MPTRLDGLAAPKGDEPGGGAATKAMLELVNGRTLRCERDGERTHDRCVAVCYLDGADIAAIMVRQGLARDMRGSAAGAIARRKENRRGQCPVLTVELQIKRTCQHVFH